MKAFKPPFKLFWGIVFFFLIVFSGTGFVWGQSGNLIRSDLEFLSENVCFEGGITLQEAGEGSWTSKWIDGQERTGSLKLEVWAGIDMFINHSIEKVIKGSEKPYTDPAGVVHDWYGRCMMAVIDSDRWIMAVRSGTNHINWEEGDAIHLLTSTDEGRNWGRLNHWFDGSPVKGLPYYDGETHSEPGLYKMPNGDLILQFWRKNFRGGTKQFRSTDNGKRWVPDQEMVKIGGFPGKVGETDLLSPLGTQNGFFDPENPGDFYMAFQVPFGDMRRVGTFLAKSDDNCKSYTFLSWMFPVGYNNFEPSVEYVGNRTIVAVTRDNGKRHTWQSVSTDMGVTFSPPADISEQIDGGVPNGLWQRARLYTESNPSFRWRNPLDYSRGEGRLWGFGIHCNGGDFRFPQTRKPVVYWSDDQGKSWLGPFLLHGPMYPGADTGYGDMKRRQDGTFVAATYYAGSREDDRADLEQYTFNVQSAELMIEMDINNDGLSEKQTPWKHLYNGYNQVDVQHFNAIRWRFKLRLLSASAAYYPKAINLRVVP